MQKRIQASMHTRQALSDLIKGRLSTPNARADLVKPATRLIVEEALEAGRRIEKGLTETNIATNITLREASG